MERVRVIATPLTVDTMAEAGDDDPIMVTMVGEKGWLLALIALLATESDWAE